jgi:hypothetical protein
VGVDGCLPFGEAILDCRIVAEPKVPLQQLQGWLQGNRLFVLLFFMKVIASEFFLCTKKSEPHPAWDVPFESGVQGDCSMEGLLCEPATLFMQWSGSK